MNQRIWEIEWQTIRGYSIGKSASQGNSFFFRTNLNKLNATYLQDKVSALVQILLSVYGLQCLGGIFLHKVVIFFLSLRAHQGQVFDPSNKSFAFLSLSWLGHPKNVRHDTHLSYGGSGALGGLLTQFYYLRNHPRPLQGHRPPVGQVSIIPYIFGVPTPGQAQKLKTVVARITNLSVVSLQTQTKYDHFLKEYPST